MASTIYTDFQAPAIAASWLNDVNQAVYFPTVPATAVLKADLVSATDATKGAAMVGYLPASTTGAVGRLLSAKLKDILSVKDFGAVGDGTTNDTAAVQAAATYAAANNRALYFPAGTYQLNAAIAVSGNFSMYGEDRAASRLRWTAATNYGFSITLNLDGNGLSQTCDVSGMSFLATGYLAVPALQITGAAASAADRVSCRAVVRDIVCKGDTGATSSGWAVGLDFNNVSNAVADSVSSIGKVNGTEPNYTSFAGIRYNNAVSASPHAAALAVSNCNVLYAQNGIYGYDYEGILIDTCQLVGVNVGVYLGGPLTFPHSSVMNCHINASDVGITVDRVYEVLIQGNLIYNELGLYIATGINIVNGAKYTSIVGNIFENLKIAYNQNSVIVSSGSHAMIHANIFRRSDSVNGAVAGLGVWLTAGSGFCKANYNIFDSTTTQYLNSGSGNLTGDAPIPIVYPTVYGGRVSSTGSSIILPSGWSCSRTSLGVYNVTAPGGVTMANFGITATADTNVSGYVQRINTLSNGFNLSAVDSVTANNIDMGFNFTAVQYF